MCGITGLLGSEDKALARRLADAIAHRGPDGHDAFSDAGVAFGHRRLAILDREHGAQPMTSADGRFTIVYNGEVYNHQELRQHLSVDWRGHSDTETVLEAIAQWGPAAVERFEGMFALAAWDHQERRLLLARDPFGIKPLYYAFAPEGLVFASEQKAVLAHPDVPVAPDLDRIKERACLEFLTGQACLFEGLRQLPPGTWAWVRPGDRRVEWQPYYQVPTEAFGDVAAAARAVKDRLVASVREQLMSDVPLGTVLSGGLDSTLVAAIHQDLFDQPVQTFTIAESEDVEDLRRAREAAEHLGTEHHESFFGLDDVIAGLPRYTWANENINYTEYFFQPLFERMRGHVTVGLCGQGSDELWGGYARYRDPLPLARQRIARLRSARPAHEEALAVQVAQAHVAGSALAEWDQQGQLNNFQLRLVDRNSMAVSMEVRVPFLSRPLHAASRAMPWDWKLRGDIEKWILRKAFSDLGLPGHLLWRPKVPAGRATGPRVMDAFEAYAARLVPEQRLARHPLAGTFVKPAEQLVYDLWHEVFVARRGRIAGLTLEDLA